MKFLFLSTHFSETLIEKTQLYCIQHGIEVVRINLEDLLPNGINDIQVTIGENDLLFKVNQQVHHLSEFSLIWKRRISNNFLSTGRLFNSYKGIVPNYTLQQLIKEVYDLRDLILNFARNIEIPIVNDYDPACKNKPFQTIKANAFGLTCPSMLLSNSIQDINQFISQHDATITKPIGGLGYLPEEEEIMSIKTTSIDLNDTNDVSSDLIFPSFIQERIPSKYELKCILVGEELHCVKQYYKGGDIPTTDIKLAYRNQQITNEEYHLNQNVKNKVIKLCRYFKLDLCTMDIIKRSDGNYVFLEINQDGVVEYYGSFLSIPIHERIFQLLLTKSKQKKEAPILQ
ncbi:MULTISPECIES: RimK family alpha-L-glutamate ligase [unclassified Aureispira]|uniref:ATP-grasp domain-containing protein n=1 Tax=unclassified Aureispira TaxID=2649989 RepID=UPI000695F59A|nr:MULTISPECIES: hypothetical protein [unclassified Aureispira]WMX14508.1 hypothetical protein QP953_26995 [Aureispira sp. CCB-E]